VALGKRSDVFLWRNNTGMFQTLDGRPTRAGLCVGSSDLIGIVAPMGKFLALEVKRPGEKASEQQQKFLEVVRMAGGIAAVVTSVEEAIAAVESAMTKAVPPSITCPTCKGTGKGKINTSAPENEPCDDCNGYGRVRGRS
jgi:hypothetical protein